MKSLFRKVISCALSPNTEADDVWLALKTFCMPWTWKRGAAGNGVVFWFVRYFDPEVAVTFNSGRSALLALLEALGIGKGAEVLLQAFTCVAVPNSVRWAGATPVYVDIDKSFNLNVSDAEQKITSRTKAIIVQHTFGIAADMEKITAFVQKHKLLLIEDCAHGLGGAYKGQKLGTFGDAAFFSFGRDKALSSVWGGLAIVNKHCRAQNAGKKLEAYHARLPMTGLGWIAQQLLHPIAFSFVLTSYNIGLGKLLLVFLQKTRLLSKPVFRQELSGHRPGGFPAKYPNGLAILLVNQLAKLERFIAKRRSTALYYHQRVSVVSGTGFVGAATYLRYPLWVKDPQLFAREAKKRGILLGNWYHHTIDPAGTQFVDVGYTPGSCPNAEEAARHVINLPTLVDRRSAHAVAELFSVE